MIDYERSTNVIVQPGRYFLGDPCYTVPSELWDKLLTNADYFQDRPIGEVAGFRVLAFNTAHGDGEYHDQHGKAYGVDAGMIGLVPVGLISKDLDQELERYSGMGQWVVFTEPTKCYQMEGVLTFGRYSIDTDPKYGEDEWD